MIQNLIEIMGITSFDFVERKINLKIYLSTFTIALIRMSKIIILFGTIRCVHIRDVNSISLFVILGNSIQKRCLNL